MRESQITLMEHSKAKIELLSNYIEKYLNILSASQFTNDIHIFDLFCGEGIYDNTGKGSPIILLERIKDLYFKNKSKNTVANKIHCLFNDENENKIEYLKHTIKEKKLHYNDIGQLNFSSAKYQNILPEVVEKIKNLRKEKAFIFLDPYGYKEIKFSHIKNLLSSKNAELLLFLPTQFMFRFESKATPECLVDFIEELMPQKEWPVSNTGIEFISNLCEAFRNGLGKNFFVDSFIINRSTNQFFCLFFFTSHILGFEKMLESKWQIDESEGRGWHFNESNSLFGNIGNKANVDRLKFKLLGFLKEKRTNSQLYEFTLHNGYLPKHANEVLKDLQNNNKLTLTNKDGTMGRKSAFYVNYDNYKNNPNKIYLGVK